MVLPLLPKPLFFCETPTIILSFPRCSFLSQQVSCPLITKSRFQMSAVSVHFEDQSLQGLLALGSDREKRELSTCCSIKVTGWPLL